MTSDTKMLSWQKCLIINIHSIVNNYKLMAHFTLNMLYVKLFKPNNTEIIYLYLYLQVEMGYGVLVLKRVVNLLKIAKLLVSIFPSLCDYSKDIH